jgi:hypothetical protein
MIKSKTGSVHKVQLHQSAILAVLLVFIKRTFPRHVHIMAAAS